MLANSEFHTWLQSQQTDGTFSSEGSFTLKQERSWQKLGAFQLPFAEAWVLKLVQCAVALGVEEIRVSQNWQESVFQFIGGRDVTSQDVETAVFEMPEHLPKALLALGTAVRALGKGSKHPFCLCYGSGVAQAWTGERFVTRKTSLRQGVQFSIVVSHSEVGAGFRDMWSLSGDTLKNKMVGISQTLSGQCYPCEARLVLDGRLLNGPLQDPTFGLSSPVRPLAALSRTSEAIPTFTLFPGAVPGLCGSSDLQIDCGLGHRYKPGQSSKQSLMLVLTAFLESEPHKPLTGELRPRPQSAELLWVLDGVVTQRERLPWKGPVSYALLVNAAGLETDLTGLALRETDSYFERKEQALREAALAAQDVTWEPQSVKLYSQHPLVKLQNWLQSRFHRLVSKKQPEGVYTPGSSLELRSAQLQSATQATLNHIVS